MSVLELNGRVFDASTTGTLTLTGEGGAATTDVTQGLAKALGKLLMVQELLQVEIVLILQVLTDDWNVDIIPNTFLIICQSNDYRQQVVFSSGVWRMNGNYLG